MTAPTAARLAAADFRRLPTPPFNRAIANSQAVAWFDGRLFVGGGRESLRHGNGDTALGAEIARLDPSAETWEIVYRSPLDADGVARDRSARALAVHEGALWAAMASLRGQVVMMRSRDGARFVEVGPPGLGGESIAAVRGLVSHDGRLYASPVGVDGGQGSSDDRVATHSAVMATDNPARGWAPASEPGFGDPANESVHEIASFAGALWAATVNRRSGFELWRQDGTGWVRVLTRGAGRGPASPMPCAMAAFGDALYLGTGVQRQTGESVERFGPVAPELVRVRADGTWDLVAGEPRLTPDGLKRPLSGCGPGFDDPFVQAFTRMAVHEGRLYVGGSDWRVSPTYLQGDRPDLSPVAFEFLETETEAWRGDYGVWASGDGAVWDTVTTKGLGDPGSKPTRFGVSALLSTPLGLVAVPAAQAGGGAGSGPEVFVGAEEPAR